MHLKFKKIIQISCLILILNCKVVYAATGSNTRQTAADELSLENELDQALDNSDTKSTKTGNVPVSEEIKPDDFPQEPVMTADSVAPESTIESPSEPRLVNEMYFDQYEPQIDLYDQDFALRGFSMGFVMYNQNYNIHAGLSGTAPTGKFETDLSAGTADYQSVGVMGRYVILPYNKIGTDLNLSLSSSVNHDSVGSTPISQLKGELNLGYAWRAASHLSVYLLGGIGFEIVKGTDIEKVLVPDGGQLQAGGGFGVGKNLNIEFFYAYSQHRLQGSFFTSALNAATASGVTAPVVSNKPSVTSNTLQARVLVAF